MKNNQRRIEKGLKKVKIEKGNKSGKKGNKIPIRKGENIPNRIGKK